MGGYGIDDLGGGIVGLVILAGLFLTAILWLLLPFVVFSINNKLREMVAISSRSEQRLADIESRMVRPIE